MVEKENLWDDIQFNSPNEKKFHDNFDAIKEKNQKYSQAIRENQTISDNTLLKRFTI